jgi:hypothetical protein
VFFLLLISWKVQGGLGLRSKYNCKNSSLRQFPVITSFRKLVMAQFNFTYATGTTIQQALGMEVAGRIWSQHLTDNATINVHLQMTGTGLAADSLGASLSGIAPDQSYASFVSGINAGSKSADDVTTLAQTLNNASSYTFVNPQATTATSTVTSTATTLNLTRANAKAAGLITGSNTALDGVVQLNTLANTAGVTWNYDYARSSAIGSSQVDFLSTALHELGHVMGFMSGVDWSLTDTGTATAASQLKIFALDLFRRSSTTQPYNATASVSDERYGITSNFSWDRSTNQGNFSKGVFTQFGGDGFQPSHWTEGQGLMDPTMTTAERLTVTERDLRALDVIGWDRATTAPSYTYASVTADAKTALAQRLGVTVAWLDANLSTSPTALVQDRSSDVNQMIVNSQVYGSSWSGSGGGSLPPQILSQKISALINTSGLAETFTTPVELVFKDLGLQQSQFHKVTGTDNIDRLQGGKQADLLVGNNGDDILLGGKGDDALFGGNGNDRLEGGQGNDLLVGGYGTDLLMGGKGNDRFVFQSGMGIDTVQDFQRGKDKIQLLGELSFGQLEIHQQGRNTTLGLGGETIMVLKNVQSSSLSESDFLSRSINL